MNFSESVLFQCSFKTIAELRFKCFVDPEYSLLKFPPSYTLAIILNAHKMHPFLSHQIYTIISCEKSGNDFNLDTEIISKY